MGVFELELTKMKGSILFIFVLQGLSLLVAGQEASVESVFSPSENFPLPKEVIDSPRAQCCPTIEIDLTGDPLGYQFGLVGNYLMGDDLVNGRPYWVKENFAYGIWYTWANVNAWIVGSIGNLGTNTGGLGSLCTEECGYCCEEWKYSNTIGQWTVSDEIFILVDGDCSLSACGL